MSLSSDKTWVNEQVGTGFQAPGVVRQRKFEATVVKTIDMRGPATNVESCLDRGNEKKRANIDEYQTKKKQSKKSGKCREEFNPILQLLAARISARPREFTLSNS